jgi:hypothetical protein
VGVFVGDFLVGSGVIQNDFCGIAVRGNLAAVSDETGAAEGDPLTIKIKTASGEEKAVVIKVLEGELTYTTDGFTAVRLEGVTAPLEFGISSVYPNPFNSSTRISFSVGAQGLAPVRLAIYDISGREVYSAVAAPSVTGIGKTPPTPPAIAGGDSRTLVWDASDQPAGLYFVRLKAGSMVSSQRLVIVK